MAKSDWTVVSVNEPSPEVLERWYQYQIELAKRIAQRKMKAQREAEANGLLSKAHLQEPGRP